jgi:Tol biopolymer transport system component/tRNA A-37 threonylcarbamoyl transferase component Bud32
MPIHPGTTLGPYSVTAKIGEGGMGEVYRARDTKLDRDVALKVLPQAFTQDPDRLARFEREAKVLASLNHPNIGHIYGLEEAGGQKALVLELVEGPTLADRIAQGPIPLDEALPIAKQIAEALEAAHEAGVIHRDLKPANIKVKDDGTVKVLDFGLAKAFQPDASDVSQSMSPTISLTAAATQMGMVIGTAAYMAPEQAKGKVADKRADIWAFGAVLYEMLTGQKPFVGEDVSDTLATVLKTDPVWNALPADTPPRLRQLMQTCLQKNPKQRVHDMADVRLAMEGAFETTVSETPGPAAQPAWWRQALPVAVALVVGSLISGLAFVSLTGGPADREVIRLTVASDLPLREDAALSPDGRHLAYVAGVAGSRRIWVRSLDQVGARGLDGTENGEHPFWSPDSRFLGFFTPDGKLKRIDVAGGPAQTLCDVPRPVWRAGGCWSQDDTILFGTGSGPIQRVAATGGIPSDVTSLGEDVGQMWPRFLPDGEHFLYLALRPVGEEDAVYVGSLESTEGKRVVATEYQAAYAVGHLLFLRGDVLMAQGFDSDALELRGDPFPVAEGIVVNQNRRVAAFDASDGGTLAYQANRVGDLFNLIWVDRSGNRVGSVGSSGVYGNPALSPDRTTLAVDRMDPTTETTDIWLFDLSREDDGRRLTFDPADDSTPTWSPDGSVIAFSSTRDGSPGKILTRSATGSGAAEPLQEFPETFISPMFWSEDGEFLTFVELTTTGVDQWILPLSGGGEPTVLHQSSSDEALATLSPDGRWVAYNATDVSGQWDVYVESFPLGRGRWAISTTGGLQPRWRADGHELFFWSYSGELVAVEVDTQGDTFDHRTPEPLFPVNIRTYLQRSSYDVTADGQRFLVNSLSADNAPITWVLNWTAELDE